MIFNLAGGNSGGGTTGWTDISSEIAAINPDVDAVFAITDGTLVYVYAERAYTVQLPSAYKPTQSACGSAVNSNGEATVIVAIPDEELITENMGDIFTGTIIYPIGTVN